MTHDPMPDIHDGGPAFPHDAIHQNAGGFAEPDPGMSLRDWFAGQALTGLLAAYEGRGTYLEVAADAWCFADAMLVARAKCAEKEQPHA